MGGPVRRLAPLAEVVDTCPAVQYIASTTEQEFSISASFPIEVVSVGDELLDGLIREGNALFLAERLAERGLAIRRHLLVRDDEEDLVAAMGSVARAGARACVVSGGLGPTDDDRTAAWQGSAAQQGLAGPCLDLGPDNVLSRGRPVRIAA